MGEMTIDAFRLHMVMSQGDNGAAWNSNDLQNHTSMLSIEGYFFRRDGSRVHVHKEVERRIYRRPSGVPVRPRLPFAWRA